MASIPRAMPADCVRRLLDESKTWRRPAGLRDRAILLLLARLGLRAGDIAKMRIADIDWHRGTVKVCGKGHREVCLPLPQAAGDAVLVYLKRARPPVAIEQLLLCMQAPHRPLGHSGTVSSVVSAALRRAGILDPPSRTLLRHSAATAMLRGREPRGCSGGCSKSSGNPPSCARHVSDQAVP